MHINSRPLGEICRVKYGKGLSKKDRQPGNIPVMGSNGAVDQHIEGITNSPCIVIGRKGSIGQVHLVFSSCWPIDTAYYLDEWNEELDPEFLYYCLKIAGLSAKNKAGAIPSLLRPDLEAVPIPIISLNEQRRIVARIKECMERVEEIEGLRIAAQEENNALVQSTLFEIWKSPKLLAADKIALSKLGEITTGNTPSRKKPEYFGGHQPWVTPGDFSGRIIKTAREFLTDKGLGEGRARVVKEGSVLVVCIGATIGKMAIAGHDLGINQQINAVTFDTNKVLPEYGYWACRSLVPKIIENASKNTIPILNKSRFSLLEIPVPVKKVQEMVATRLNAAETSVSEVSVHMANTIKAAKSLRESILRKAFAGEL